MNVYVVTINEEPKRAYTNYSSAEAFVKNFKNSIYSEEDIVSWDEEAFDAHEDDGEYSFNDSVEGIMKLHPELDIEKLRKSLEFYDDSFDNYLESNRKRIEITQVPMF